MNSATEPQSLDYGSMLTFLDSLGYDWTKPVATKAIAGSTMVVQALRASFPTAGTNVPSLFGIPVYVDPVIGYENFEIRDQWDNTMVKVRVLK